MRSISIYALTRKQNIACLSRLEHQLSGREKPLKIRTWELNSMRAFVDHLEEHMPEVYRLRFFYSFQIPRLGKEFDLLQVKEKQIVNIELRCLRGRDPQAVDPEPLLLIGAGETDPVLYLYQQ